MAIAIVHRSDGSGTTFIWTDYLSKVSDDWKSKVGEGTAVDWPVGFGGKGNEGVSATVAQTVGALGYVEYAYAMQNNLTYAKMINHAGKVVAPTAAAFQAAAAGADWANAKDFRVVITDAPGDTSWPVAGSTFILMQANPVSEPRLGCGAQVLRLGLQERKEVGERSPLCSDAGQRRGANREDLEREDQRRQLLTRRTLRKRRRHGAFSTSWRPPQHIFGSDDMMSDLRQSTENTLATDMSRRYAVRRRRNVAAKIFAYGATLVGLGWLVFILATLLWKGFGGLWLEVFTHMTPPPGGKGGCSMRSLEAFF